MEENGLEPETCEKFILIHSRILHPQNAHMLDVKHSWLHLLGHSEGHLMADLTDKQLQIKEDTARCILQVADKIIPGIILKIKVHTFISRKSRFNLLMTIIISKHFRGSILMQMFA